MNSQKNTPLKPKYYIDAIFRFVFVSFLVLTITNPTSIFASEFDKYFQQGAQAYSEGRRQEALDAFRLAAKNEPSNGPVHANIASILYQLGKNDDALAEYREAVRLKPDFGGAYATMANLLARMERREEAVNEDGSFCWQIKRGSYLINRINRFGAPKADHFVYSQTAFLVPYGADAYYVGTLKIRISIKRNLIGERSIDKVLSIEVMDEYNRSQELIRSIKPDFSGTMGKSLMVRSTTLPKNVQTTSSSLVRVIQTLNAFTIPLLMMK